jgi:ATP-dependent exoDNAse (exonuclease V) alpha subunit
MNQELEPLYKKLAQFNEELEAVNVALVNQAKGALNLKKILLTKSIANLQANIQKQENQKTAITLTDILTKTDKEIFTAFENERDDALEESGVETAVTPESLEAHVAELSKNDEFANKFLEKIRKQALSTGLGDEIIPLPDEVQEEAVIENYDALEETSESEEEIAAEIEAKEKGTQESFALNIVLNPKQVAAKDMAMAGKSFCLIGAAGTGKTTAQRAVAEALLQQEQLSVSRYRTYDEDGKRQYVSGPSIAFCAYTRRAAANLQKAVHKSPILKEKLPNNIMTIHALLEFEPETYQDYNDEGKLVDKFRFVPRRDANNPLDITHLVIEEASMLDAYTLWGQLYDALKPGVQIIFIGDINQLPPVFGQSILNYALVQLPIVELTEVYRNQGIVLENAHNILGGKKLAEDQNFVIVRGKSQVQVGQQKLATILGNLFNQWLDMKGSDGLPEYDPNDCIILSPFNKQDCGTMNMNNWIAQHLGARRNAVVHEVIAGFSKLYLAVGDKVMVNKMDGVITDIYRNPNYHGREPQLAGSDLTRFGMRVLGKAGADSLDDIAVDYSSFSLEQLEQEKGERKQQASHEVVVTLDNGDIEHLSGAGDFSDQKFSLGYALTVHKAQGSEWRKVFIILHKDHATMLYRELFYTAVTRARTKVTIIAKDNVIDKAVANQRIKGNSIKDKIEFFNAGVLNNGSREEIFATK